MCSKLCVYKQTTCKTTATCFPPCTRALAHLVPRHANEGWHESHQCAEPGHCVHREALAMELHRQPGWTSRIFKAITRWPDAMSLWQQWEALYTDGENPRYRQTADTFYRTHRAAMDAGAILLWPEEEDLYTLMCMRAESGRAAFEREKQNSPINPELCEWPDSYFDEAIWFDAWPGTCRSRRWPWIRAKAAMPGAATIRRWSCWASIGRACCCVEADLARRPTPQMVADGVECFRRFRPDVFGIEVEPVSGPAGGRVRGPNSAARACWPRGPGRWRTARTNKSASAAWGRTFPRGACVSRPAVPARGCWSSNCNSSPLADHDDGPDALEMALRLAAELAGGRARDGLGHRLPVG